MTEYDASSVVQSSEWPSLVIDMSASRVALSVIDIEQAVFEVKP
jgi:hypothetical protein